MAAALANDRGWYSSVGVIDAEKVAVLELALDRLPGAPASTELYYSRISAQNLLTEVRSNVERNWPERHWPSPSLRAMTP